MKHTEAVALCRYVKAACPQQAFDEYTADAWGDLLADLRFEDCQEAAKIIVQRQAFCAPAEIRTEVRRIRGERIAAAGPIEPPEDLPDDEVAYRRWLSSARRQIADGEDNLHVFDLPERDMRVIETTFPEVPHA